MPQMATETGRDAAMLAMTSDAVAVMGTDLGRQFFFNLRVATGADRAGTTQLVEFNGEWLMRVVAGGTISAGKMGIILCRVTIGAGWKNSFTRRMLRMAIDAGQFSLMGLAGAVECFDDRAMTTDTEGGTDLGGKLSRSRPMRLMTGATVGCRHRLIVSLMTVATGR